MMRGTTVMARAIKARSRQEAVEAANLAALKIRQASECISFAGALAHPDPDEAWGYIVTAKEHLAIALEAVAVFNGLKGGRTEES